MTQPTEPVELAGCDITKQEGVIQLLALIQKEVCQKGVTPKKLLGIPQKSLDYLYNMAYLLYNNGKYPEAGEIFRHLVLVDPHSYAYALGLAACTEELKAYDLATQAYSLAYLCNPTDPTALYRAAECCMKLNNNAAAAGYFKQCIEVAGNQPAFQQIKEKAALTLKNLKIT